MKYYLLSFFIVLSCEAFSQTHQDTIRSLQQTAALYDLNFTDAEADSMIGNINNWKRTYVRMHELLPTNDLAFPFAFEPAPPGTVIPTSQKKITWEIPANVQLPSNRNDLAFYSVLQLASLIKNKKITSVQLTEFFIDRLKKWGDTLQSVITLTEDTALAQAKKADEEIKKGIYRGPLHGIPYGLKTFLQ
jgi:hypothetical protein